MNYKRLYLKLAKAIDQTGCLIIDNNDFGFASDLPGRLIWINCRLSFRNKLFVLAHEAGHVLTFKSGELIPLKKMISSQNRANQTAIHILAHLGVPAEQFNRYCRKAEKQTRFKGWREIKKELRKP